MAELRKGITGRGSETEESLSEDWRDVERDFIDKHDYRVINGELKEAVDRVAAIIMAEHSREVSEDVYKIIERHKEEI